MTQVSYVAHGSLVFTFSSSEICMADSEGGIPTPMRKIKSREKEERREGDKCTMILIKIQFKFRTVINTTVIVFENPIFPRVLGIHCMWILGFCPLGLSPKLYTEPYRPVEIDPRF